MKIKWREERYYLDLGHMWQKNVFDAQNLAKISHFCQIWGPYHRNVDWWSLTFTIAFNFYIFDDYICKKKKSLMANSVTLKPTKITMWFWRTSFLISDAVLFCFYFTIALSKYSIVSNTYLLVLKFSYNNC